MQHKRRLPSLTAMAVAFARAIPAAAADSAVASIDPIAEFLLPPVLGGLARAARYASSGRGPADRIIRAMSLGLVDHVELRTRAIDRIVASTASTGVEQLVVLGAGLDVRAWRMVELGASIVFEIDQPATQLYKRDRVEKFTKRAREVRFIPVDFETDDLAVRLEAGGHDLMRPTTWIWEGVTPYLTPEAIAATLDVLTSRSAPGSVAVVTYGTPELAAIPRALLPVVTSALRVIGEPLRGLMSPSAAASLFSARGFTVASDAGSEAWAASEGARRPLVVIAERLLIARCRAKARGPAADN